MSNTMVLANVAENSHDWNRESNGTAVAMALVSGTPYIAAGHSATDGARYTLFQFTPPDVGRSARLNMVTDGGKTWGDERSCTALAFGLVGADSYLAVGRDSGDNHRFEICKFNGTLLGNPVLGGANWGSKYGCTAIAFCTLATKTYVALGRSAGSDARVIIYSFDGTTLGSLTEAATGWGDDACCTSLSFCQLSGKTYLAVGRKFKEGAQVFIYEFDGKKLNLVTEEGENWGDGRHCHSLQFTLQGNKSYLAVGRDSGPNARVILYSFDGQLLKSVADAGSEWGDERSCSAVGFAADSTNLYLLAGRSYGDNARVFAYRAVAPESPTLVTVADNQLEAWDTDWGVTGLAALSISTSTGPVPFAAVTRSAEKNARLFVYQLTSV